MTRKIPTLDFSRSVPIKEEVDVFVAGGGPAGLAAAWAAAKSGAKVFLVEATGCFGGMGTAGGLPMFCYLTDHVHFVSSGFGSEVYERMWSAGAAGPEMKKENPHGAVLYNGEILKRVYDRMVEEAGIRFTFFTHFLSLHPSTGKPEVAICHGKGGLFGIAAKVFVDGTGDGDLCVEAGASFEKGDETGAMQPGTLCSLWSGIDWERAKAAGCNWYQQSSFLKKAIEDGIFTTPDPHMPGLCQISSDAGWGNIGHTFGVDGTDIDSLTQAVVYGRRILPEYERFFKEYLQGFERMTLVGTGAILGVRETRRIVCDYRLNVNDFLKRAIFEDEIGRFAYPVDLHATSLDPAKTKAFEEEFQSMRLKPGENYGIPLRSLLPKGLENVLVAGRCIGCDRSIQGSIRVMPGCFITGQAAGVAAALAARQGGAVRKVPVRAVQAQLHKLGAYLPHFTPEHP